MSEPPEVPRGWRCLTMGEIISEEQFQPLWKIMSTEKDPIVRVRKLSAELHKHRAQLEARDVNPDYLAYYLEYILVSREEELE